MALIIDPDSIPFSDPKPKGIRAADLKARALHGLSWSIPLLRKARVEMVRDQSGHFVEAIVHQERCDHYVEHPTLEQSRAGVVHCTRPENPTGLCGPGYCVFGRFSYEFRNRVRAGDGGVREIPQPGAD